MKAPLAYGITSRPKLRPNRKKNQSQNSKIKKKLGWYLVTSATVLVIIFLCVFNKEKNNASISANEPKENSEQTSAYENSADSELDHSHPMGEAGFQSGPVGIGVQERDGLAELIL